jgi:hypothetical protein
MARILLLACLATFFNLTAVAADDNRELGRPKTGRPGELKPEEEDRLDKVIDNFILHDVGVRRDPKAVEAFKELGPAAIPALIRGLNKAATMSHSCPAASISRKLRTLLRASEDPEVLDFARQNIGAGVTPATPYKGLLNELKVVAILRKSQLAQGQSPRPGEPGSKGYHSPGEGKPK